MPVATSGTRRGAALGGEDAAGGEVPAPEGLEVLVVEVSGHALEERTGLRQVVVPSAGAVEDEVSLRPAPDRRSFRHLDRGHVAFAEQGEIGGDTGIAVGIAADQRVGLTQEPRGGVSIAPLEGVASERDAELDTLTVVRKPLLLEAHKGGRVWLEDSPGIVCLSTWVEGDVDEAACEAQPACEA